MASVFQWREEFSVGIASIDAQHKKLISYVDELHGAMSERRGSEVVGKVLDNLIKYTIEHFTYEERLFAQYKYPEAASHKAAHDALTKKAGELQQKYKKNTLTISLETMQFLQDWLTKHILGEDKKYSGFLREHGVK